jgi:hypothetical protein
MLRTVLLGFEAWPSLNFVVSVGSLLQNFDQIWFIMQNYVIPCNDILDNCSAD